MEMAKGTNAEDKRYKTLKHEFFDQFKSKDVAISARFRRPTRPEVSRVQQQALKKADQAFHNLVMETVHPEDKEYLKASLEDYPALASTFGGALMSSCGLGDLGNS